MRILSHNPACSQKTRLSGDPFPSLRTNNLVHETPSSPTTVGYTIGRFNPLQNGHLAMLAQVRDENDHMVVLVGSAAESRTHKNPLSFEERKSVLRQLFPKAVVLPLPDMPSDEDWVRMMESTVLMGIDSLRLEGPVQARLYSADATRADDYSLRCGWVANMGHQVVPVTPVKAATDLSSTLVRDRWFTGQYGDLPDLVPAPTLELLRTLQLDWMRTHYVKKLPAGELGAKNSAFVAFVSEPEHIYKDNSRCASWGPDVANSKLATLGYLTSSSP